MPSNNQDNIQWAGLYWWINLLMVLIALSEFILDHLSVQWDEMFMRVLTCESPLVHKVCHELGLREEDAVQLINTEFIHLVNVVTAIQILVERLNLISWTHIQETHKDELYCTAQVLPSNYVKSLTLFTIQFTFS